MKEVRELILHLSRERGRPCFFVAPPPRNRDGGQPDGDHQSWRTGDPGGVEELLSKGESYVILRAEPSDAVRRTLAQLPQLLKFRDAEEGFRLEIRPADVPALTRKLIENDVQVNAIVPRRSLEDYSCR